MEFLHQVSQIDVEAEAGFNVALLICKPLHINQFVHSAQLQLIDQRLLDTAPLAGSSRLAKNYSHFSRLDV